MEKYNKTVDSIKKQEISLTEVKNKLEDLVNYKSTPMSIKNLEKQIKTSDAELTLLKNKLEDLGSDIEFSYSDKNSVNLSKQYVELEERISIVTEKNAQLRKELNLLKVNPQASNEVQILSKKIELAESKLSDTKDKANELKDSIAEALNPKEDVLAKKVDNVNDKLDKGNSKLEVFGKKILKYLASKKTGKQLNTINSGLNKFRRRIMSLISSIAIFNLIGSGLTSMRNSFMEMLKTNKNFSSSLNQIKANLMTAFAPIYNAVLPALNSLMNVLKEITGTLAIFISGIFGTSLKNATKQAKKLSSSLGGVAKNSEKTSGSLSKIDHLEVIGDDSGSSGNSGGGIADIDYSGAVTSNTKLLNILNKIKTLINDKDWYNLGKYISEGIGNALQWLVKKIQNIDWAEVGRNLSKFLEGIDWSAITVGLVMAFGEAILALQEMFLNINWEVVARNLSIGLGNAILKLGDYIKQIKWEELAQKITEIFVNIDWAYVGNAIIDALWNWILGINTLFLKIDWGQVGQTLSNAAHSWIQNITEKFQTTNWAELGKMIVDAIFNFWRNVDWWGLAKDMMVGLFYGLVALIDFVLGAFSELLLKILEFFGIHSPSTVFENMGINIMQGLFNGIISLKDKVLDAFRDVWSGTKEVFSKVGSFFKDTFTNAWTLVKNVFSTGGKIFDGIKEGIVNAFTNITNKIISGINKVVAVPFNGINKALRKIKGIDILGLKPFDWVTTISVPKIPQLAEGTVIPPRQRFIAELGDQRKGVNIEAPLETIKQADREVMLEFMDMLNNLNSKEKEIVFKNLTIVAQFGTKSAQKLVYDSVRLSEKELGRPLFVS